MRIARVKIGSEFALAVVADGEVRLLEAWRTGDPLRTPFQLPENPMDLYGPVLSPDDVQFLPPVSMGNKIICLGLNYRDHVDESDEQKPENPGLFAKLPDAFVGHKEKIHLPSVSTQFDFEGELAVVMGRHARHVSAREAMEHVYGFTILMDGSVRDYQHHSLTAGKGFFQSSGLGPWIVKADAIDHKSLTLETWLNGKKVQSSNTSLMIYDIPTAIEYISRWTPLAPGDIISTGTPSGVGVARKPPLWMKAGDIIEVTISGIGTLSNEVANEG